MVQIKCQQHPHGLSHASQAYLRGVIAHSLDHDCCLLVAPRHHHSARIADAWVGLLAVA